MKKKTHKMMPKDYEKLGKAMEDVYLSGYVNNVRFIWFTMLRGIIYGVGLFVGGTIVVALILSILTHFNNVPFVQKIVDTANKTSIKE